MISLCVPCCCKDSATGSGLLFFYGFMWIQAYAWIFLSVCCMSCGDIPHVFGTVPNMTWGISPRDVRHRTVNTHVDKGIEIPTSAFYDFTG
jgi:hypothetical protein